MIASIGLAVFIAGCSAIPLRTAGPPNPGGICDDGLAAGRLVADSRSGLGLADGSGNVSPITWPHSYTAQREITGLVLLDAGGVVAREGDFVQLTGGLGADGIFAMCQASQVKVVPPTSGP